MSETNVDIARRMMEDAFRELRDGHLDDAIQLYQASISIHPTPEAHTFLGWTYSKQSRYEDAIQECMNAIQLDPDFGNPYNDIGSYLMELDRWDEAVEWLDKAIYAPRYESRAYPWMNMARLHRHYGREIEAMQAYKQAWMEERTYVPAMSAYYDLLTKLN